MICLFSMNFLTYKMIYKFIYFKNFYKIRFENVAKESSDFLVTVS